MAGRGKTWKSLVASIPALGINVGLNVWLIPKYGGSGAALASTISYGVMGVIYLRLYVYETKLTWMDVWAFKRDDFGMLFQPIMKWIKKNKL